MYTAQTAIAEAWALILRIMSYEEFGEVRLRALGGSIAEALLDARAAQAEADGNEDAAAVLREQRSLVWKR
jgi:hypothetical protein